MLEDIEWSNVWREKVNSGLPRVLLIGDSIVDGSKRLVGKVLGDRAAISAFTTSKALDNPHYLEEIDLLMAQEQYAYTAVYFNNGLHAGGLKSEEYARYYAAAVRFLQEKLPSARIVLGLSTPVTRSQADPGATDAPITSRMQYAEADATIRAYNMQVRALAEELSLSYLDAYACVDGKTEWRTPDGFHYTPEGYQHLAEQIASVLL